MIMTCEKDYPDKDTKAFMLIVDTLAFAMISTFFYVFLSAFNSPNKTVHISIDVLGEANIELIMFIVIMGLLLISIIMQGLRVFNDSSWDQLSFLLILFIMGGLIVMIIFVWPVVTKVILSG